MPYWTAILLGLIEGVSEFLPVSSTGHLLIAQHWVDRQSGLFNIVIQCGAVLAVLAVFWRRALELGTRWQDPGNRDYLAKLAAAFLVTAAGGFALKQAGVELPESPLPVAIATLVGGILILVVERHARGRAFQDTVTWPIALAVGSAQILAAAFPGTSRSGASILFALALGLSRPKAAEFSFLLGIPTLLAAGAYEAFKELRLGAASTTQWDQVAVGSATAAVTAFAVVRWLLHYVQRHDFALFGWYRIVLGGGLLLFVAEAAPPAQGPAATAPGASAPLPLLAAGFGPGPAAATPRPAPTITSLAGDGQRGFTGNGGPARAARIANPYGVVRGPDGALYVCEIDNHVIRRISPEGVLSVVAGNGTRGRPTDNQPATQAALNEPYEVRFDRGGNLVFVDMRNHVVQRVDAKTGLLSTLAGDGQPGFAGDGGPATRARLNQPHSIQLDREDNLYICDIGNHRIRRVEARTGVITTFAGTGEKRLPKDGAAFATSPLFGPRALDFDRDGNLWLALREGNAVYRLDLRAGTLHHAAGTGQKGFTGHGGPARLATLSGPKGLAIGPNGDVYLADTESHSIRKIDLRRGSLELVAGTGEKGDGPEGDPLRCRLNRPHGVFVDADGGVLIGDSEAHRVRLVR